MDQPIFRGNRFSYFQTDMAIVNGRCFKQGNRERNRKECSNYNFVVFL